MKQEDAMKFQIFESELSQIQNFMSRIEIQIREVTTLLENIKEFGKISTGEEILFPVADGIFAKGTLIQSEKLKVNVGQNIVVDKTIEETQELIEQQLENLQKQQQKMLLREEEIYKELEKLDERVKNV